MIFLINKMVIATVKGESKLYDYAELMTLAIPWFKILCLSCDALSPTETILIIYCKI
jgi:hypothetical protein